MVEQTVRRRLDKDGYRLNKFGEDCYRVIDHESGGISLGWEPLGVLFEEVLEWMADEKSI